MLEQSELESDDAAPLPVEDSGNEKGDRRRFTADPQFLDLVDSVFRNRSLSDAVSPSIPEGNVQICDPCRIDGISTGGT